MNVFSNPSSEISSGASLKTGLLIQGPVISPGFGPYEFSPNGSYGRSWIEFDASLNIRQLINHGSKLFDFVVLVTWKREDNNFVTDFKYEDNVFLIELVEDEFLIEQEILGIHKYHQVFSTREGAKFLWELGATSIAKIRTDQELNLNALRREVIQNCKMNSYSIGVPNINLFELDRLTDFYFVGNSKVIFSVFSDYLSTAELHEDTHKDYFYKFGNSLQYFSRNRISDTSLFQLDFFKLPYYWTEFFYPLSPKLYKSMRWRGRKVNFRLNSWIRWFRVLHSTSSFQARLFTVLNGVFLFVVQLAKRPLMKHWSKLVFVLSRESTKFKYRKS